MLNRTLQLLLAGCLMTGTLWAADNPFLGKWKVNPSKSMLNNEVKVEAAGANKYAICDYTQGCSAACFDRPGARSPSR
jgi:hypothetical protein